MTPNHRQNVRQIARRVRGIRFPLVFFSGFCGAAQARGLDLTLVCPRGGAGLVGDAKPAAERTADSTASAGDPFSPCVFFRGFAELLRLLSLLSKSIKKNS